MVDIFLLTKAPREQRSELCFKLMERSDSPKLYLVGDGIYNLLNIVDPSAYKAVACREDVLARGLSQMADVAMPDDFYGELVKDIMENSEHVFTF